MDTVLDGQQVLYSVPVYSSHPLLVISCFHTLSRVHTDAYTEINRHRDTVRQGMARNRTEYSIR